MLDSRKPPRPAECHAESRTAEPVCADDLWTPEFGAHEDAISEYGVVEGAHDDAQMIFRQVIERTPADHFARDEARCGWA